jgi:ATP-dependent Clp protease ATP-binding subunit ClpC
MFERYTEKARNVIRFARYEVSRYGAPVIETEHLLLGLLREDEALVRLFLHSQEAIDGIRREIDERSTRREKVTLSLEFPFSHECKRVLASADDEALELKQRHIGTEHLLLGLLREEQFGAARLLHERGLRLSQARDEIARGNSAEAAGA